MNKLWSLLDETGHHSSSIINFSLSAPLPLFSVNITFSGVQPFGTTQTYKEEEKSNTVEKARRQNNIEAVSANSRVSCCFRKSLVPSLWRMQEEHNRRGIFSGMVPRIRSYKYIKTISSGVLLAFRMDTEHIREEGTNS